MQGEGRHPRPVMLLLSAHFFPVCPKFALPKGSRGVMTEEPTGEGRKETGVTEEVSVGQGSRGSLSGGVCRGGGKGGWGALEGEVHGSLDCDAGAGRGPSSAHLSPGGGFIRGESRGQGHSPVSGARSGHEDGWRPCLP